MYFYETLKEIMNQKNLKVADVARLCNLSDSTVRSIFSRKQKSVALDVAFKLSDGLDVSLKELNGNVSLSPSEMVEVKEDTQDIILTRHEKKLIISYRKHIELQSAINKMLDICSSDTNVHPVRIAAKGQGTFKKSISDEQRKRAAAALHAMQDEEE